MDTLRLTIVHFVVDAQLHLEGVVHAVLLLELSVEPTDLFT